MGEKGNDMGAEIRFLTFNDCSTRDKLFKAWRERVEEDQFNRGHGTYNGSIAHCDLTIHRNRFDTLEQAEKFAYQLDVDKRQAVAIGYGNPDKAFPQKASDKKLAADHAAVKKAVDNFEFEILQRFVAGKSSSKKCTHCDSVISKRSRQPLAKQPPSRDQDHFAYRDAIRDLTGCPACGHNLLVTDTDKKRRESLDKRFRDLTTKLDQAKKDFAAKNPPCGYFVAAACPS